MMEKINYENLINWSELSRLITHGDRNCIRPKKRPKKHRDALKRLFHDELPNWADKYFDDNSKS
jgi:hypothetical protein